MKNQQAVKYSEPISDFADAVRQGFSSYPKFISSKYFYNQTGSTLFNEITRLPEYYLPRSENEILEKYSTEIVKHVRNDAVNVIELGCGTSHKVSYILSALNKKISKISYMPIDICSESISEISKHVYSQFPKIKIRGLVSDYTSLFDVHEILEGPTNLVLFFGANIGNLAWLECIHFLRTVRARLKPNDLLLIGFDTIKDPSVFNLAYNDSKGITAKFNLNLLDRMNQELGANFILKQFKHYGFYNPQLEAMESYLVSLRDQTVYVSELGQSFYFRDQEPIHTEYSFKYTVEKIQKLARFGGFDIKAQYFDQRKYFVSSLWMPD